MKSLIVFALFLTGCTVSTQQIEAAQKVCEPNGGVAQLDGSVTTWSVEVLCKNGTRVSTRTSLVLPNTKE